MVGGRNLEISCLHSCSFVLELHVMLGLSVGILKFLVFIHVVLYFIYMLGLSDFEIDTIDCLRTC